MKKLLTICLLSITLGTMASCKLQPADAVEPVVYNYDDKEHGIFSYSIGLNESKGITLIRLQNDLYNSNYWHEFQDSLNFYEEWVKSVTLYDTNDNVIEDIFECKLPSIYGNFKSIKDSNGVLTFTCLEEFDTPIYIKTICFNFDRGEMNFDTDICFEFNKEFETYPAFHPSYSFDNRYWLTGGETSYPWSKINIFEKTSILDFDVLYNREEDEVVINSISFSKNLLYYMDNVSFAKFDKNVSCHMLKGRILDEYASDDKIEFATFENPINVFEEVEEGQALIFKFNTKKKITKVVGGDIIYDISINGNNYKIKDMFILY